VCAAGWNGEKFTKTPILGLEGHSRSSMLVAPESSSAARLCLSAIALTLDELRWW